MSQERVLIKKKKKRTISLKSKIRRSMFTNTGLTIILFTIALLGFVSFIFSSFGYFVAYSQTKQLTEWLGSEDFLDYAGVGELRQIIRPKYDKSWLPYVFENNDAIVLLKPEQMVSGPLSNDSLLNAELAGQDGSGNLTVLQFRFKLGDHIVYTSREFNDPTDYKMLNTFVSMPFTSVTGETGVLESKVTPKLLGFVYLLVSILIVTMAAIGMMMSMVMAALFTRNIVKPIRSLIIKMNQISEEDLMEVVQTEISVHKPVQEIIELTDASNAIFLKMREFANLLEAQKKELVAQNDELEASSDQLSDLNAEINLFNIRLSSILNHSGQGFLAFGSDLKIQAVYSKECVAIFGCEIENRVFSDLIYAQNEDIFFLNKLYLKVLDTSLDPELYLSLLPNECERDGRFYQIEHRLIPAEDMGRSMMIILTDTTDRKKVEEAVRKEQTNLRRVVKVVRFTQEFKSIYEDMKNYDFEVIRPAKLLESLNRDQFYEIFRHLHNFKGLLSQFDFMQSVKKIDGYESIFTDLLNKSEFSPTDALDVVLKIDLLATLQEDLAIVTLYLGEGLYKQSQRLQIEESKLVALENHLKANLPVEALKLIMPYVQDLRDRRLSQLFRSLPEYALKLADRLGKVIDPLKISGDDIICEVPRYMAFSKSMIHLVRNAIDHGIETVDERLENDKLEAGSVELILTKDAEDGICITFKDDGAGIDLETLKSNIIELGIVDEETLLSWSEDEILNTIFMDSVTTEEEATDISGRGVGLSAVKHEVEALGGSIRVETEAGKGTTFKIELPLIREDYVEALNIEGFENALGLTTKSLLENYTKQTYETLPCLGDERIELFQFSALINTKGLLNCLIVLSLTEEMITAVGRGYLNCDDYLSAEEQEDLVLELANIILGNSLESLGVLSDQVRLGTPTLVCYNGATVKYSDSAIKTLKWTSGRCSAHLSVVYF